MKKRKTITELMSQIPKEYQKDLKNITEYWYNDGKLHGRIEVLELVKRLAEIPPDLIQDYDIRNDSEIEGG